MRICIVGGGHIGTALACYFKHYDPAMSVAVYTRRPEKFSRILHCRDIEGGFEYDAEPDVISGDPSLAAAGADIVFIALPHFAVEKAFGDIAPYVAEKAFIGVIPGYGGCEFFFGRYFDEEKTLFGFQRVPFIARLAEYGHTATISSWKPFSVVAVQRRERLDAACALIEKCGLKTEKAESFIAVAMAATNPILHTARLFDLFGEHGCEYVYPKQYKLYAEWTDRASAVMIGMDNELHRMLDKLEGVDTSSVRPLTEHYESPTVEAMTRKIRRIPSFMSINAPMTEAPEGGFTADRNSRLFTEDFPFGLAIIKANCVLFGVDTPVIDSVLKWYESFLGVEWFVGGDFTGKDLSKTGIPQKYGVASREDFLRYYR